MNLRRWGAVLAAVLGFLVAFELTARVEDWVRYRMPFDSPYRSEGDLAVRDSLGVHGRPNARYLKWQMNSLGLRGPEVTAARPEGVLRVVVVGASEAFGQSESPGQELPRQLEDTLRARLMDMDAPWTGVQVLNAAFFGMSLPTVLQDIQLRLRHFEPQVIVLYPTTAQYLANDRPEPSTPGAGAAPAVDRRMAWWPRSLARLREQLKRVTPAFLRQWRWNREYAAAARGRPDGWQFEEVPAERLAAFDADLRTFVGTVRSIGAAPVIATHANRFVGGAATDSSLLDAWQRFYPRASGPVILAFDSAGAPVTAGVARDSSVPLADVREALSRCVECFADYAHLTDEGAARAASRAADAVLAAAGLGSLLAPPRRVMAGP